MKNEKHLKQVKNDWKIMKNILKSMINNEKQLKLAKSMQNSQQYV